MTYLWVFLASVLSVVYLFFITKILGYRQLSQLSPFDYVNGISIGSIAANLAIEPERWLEHLIALSVFGALTLLCSFLTNKSMRFRRFVAGTPLVLLDHGKLYEKNFRRVKLDINEFLTLCRAAGYFDLSGIGTAILEENGSLSVFPKSADRPLTAKDMSLSLPEDELAAAVVIDGKIMPSLGSIDGMGDKAAEAMMEAAKDGPFLSRDDLRSRSKAPQNVIDKMGELGLLGSLPQSNQLSLFDFM